jgi:hypothetical protein
VQHDLHEVRCPCGREHAAPRPAGVPGSALSIGPRLRALGGYLVVFQHVPVERCRLLIADVTGAPVSDGFVRSCLARASSLLKDVVALIRELITASAVAGNGLNAYAGGRGALGVASRTAATDRDRKHVGGDGHLDQRDRQPLDGVPQLAR